MIRKVLFWVLLFVVLIFMGSGCMHFSIQKNTDYPESLFRQKLEKLESLGGASRENPVRASRLNVLIYDGEDRELISFWVLIHTACENLDEIDQKDQEKTAKYALKVSGVNWKCLKELEGFGSGLIAEIRDLQENDHILIWLD
jgi:hypothetical protein